MATEKRLIDANALKEYLNSIEASGGHKYYRKGMDDVLHFHMPNIIEDAPTVDAVEVVLCKECMCCRGVESTENRALECSNPLGLPIITPDTYCAYGERRTNDR